MELLTKKKKKFIDDCVGNRSLVQVISVDERMSGRLVGEGEGVTLVTGPRHAGTAVGWEEDLLRDNGLRGLLPSPVR